MGCEADLNSKQNQESVLVALVKKRSMAVVNSDTAVLSDILAKDFRYVNIFGEIQSRERYLSNNASLGSDSSRWISQDLDSIVVKIFDKTAIVTFRVLDKFVYEGVPAQNHCRSTFVYNLQGDSWKCLMGHTTKIE